MKHLYDDNFSGMVNGRINRRVVLSELSSNRYILDTAQKRFFRKTRRAMLYIIIGALIAVSSWAVADWLAFDKGYDSAIMSVYTGDKHSVNKNKSDAYKKLSEKLSIGGAGDEGIRRVESDR